jgi:hypothetical protein
MIWTVLEVGQAKQQYLLLWQGLLVARIQHLTVKIELYTTAKTASSALI